MHLCFSCLFFLLNLVCDIFSLSVSKILSTNLLTELGIDRLGIYYKTSQCLIKSLREFLRDVMPVSVVLCALELGYLTSIFCKTK